MRILAVANQKGGVGKTTTAINLAAGLSELGKRVLLLDLDPQGNASTGLGVPTAERRDTVFDVLTGEKSVLQAAMPTALSGVDLVPANPELSAIEVELMARERRSFLLRHALRTLDVKHAGHDYIIIDCPPSLNILTINALVAADRLLVPLQSEFFALEGLSQLLLTVRQIRDTANPALRIEGVLLTMHDRRNRLAQQVEEDARATLGELVFRTVIPRNVRISEAPSHAMPVLEYDPHCKGAEAYRELARELLDRHKDQAAA